MQTKKQNQCAGSIGILEGAHAWRKFFCQNGFINKT